MQKPIFVLQSPLWKDLCAIAESYGIEVPKGIKDNAYKYSDWEAAGRYDRHFSVRTDSIEKAVRLAEEWLRKITA